MGKRRNHHPPHQKELEGREDPKRVKLAEHGSRVNPAPESEARRGLMADHRISPLVTSLTTALATRSPPQPRPLPTSIGPDPALPGTVMGRKPELPPLPPVHDEKLLKQVFTHQGAVHAPNASRVHLSYERLEFLGDAYLECICSRMVFRRFPTSTAGQLSQTRQTLVNNGTLAEFSLAYGFDRRLLTPPDSDTTIPKDPKQRVKWLADVFEAYVAALILDSPATGFTTAEAWLTALWEPAVAQPCSGPISMDAKQELAVKVLTTGVRVSYVQDREPERTTDKSGAATFFVSVMLTGYGWHNLRLGSGQGRSKVEAGNAAAMHALSNRPLIDEVGARKIDAVQAKAVHPTGKDQAREDPDGRRE